MLQWSICYNSKVLVWKVTAMIFFLFLSCFKAVVIVEICLLFFIMRVRVLCCLSLTCLTGYCRLIQQLIGNCFNAVVHNLPRNSGELLLWKFFTKVLCHLRSTPLTWIASPVIGGITSWHLHLGCAHCWRTKYFDLKFIFQTTKYLLRYITMLNMLCSIRSEMG